MAAATFSAKDLAAECGTDGRTIRKFLRNYLPAEDQPGQGGRYAFTKGEVNKIAKAFKASTKITSTDDDTDDTPTPAPKAKKGKGKKKDKDALPNPDVGGRASADRLPDEDVLDLDALDDPSLDDIEAELDDDEDIFPID